MSMNWIELNQANMAIKSGEAIGVSKAALKAALDRVHVDPKSAVEIDVCDGADGFDGGGHLKVLVFFDVASERHREARGELEKMKIAVEAVEAVEAKVVEESLRAVKRPKLVRFHLDVEGARHAVWVPIDSRLGVALRGMVMEATKSGEDTKSGESEEAMEQEKPAEPKAPGEPAEQEKPAAPVEKEPAAQETAAAKAMRLKEVARLAAEAAREAEAEAEAEAGDRREAERESTKEELGRAIEESMLAAANVERLRSKLAQQEEEERQARKRKRSSADESEPDRVPSRRVAARHEREEIVMVKDGEFKAVMGAYEGAVHDAVVERFEPTGRGGVGPASGGNSVRERVYGTVEGLGEFPVGTGWCGGEVVVVKGFKDVKKFDGVMELGDFVRFVIDVDGRCVNPMSPAEPEWCTDTERVWVKRGSVEHAGLEALIAKGRKCKWEWRPQCPPSPAYKPVSQVYRPVRPASPDPEDDEEMMD